MSLFEEVAIAWKKQEYKVPPDKVMGLIEVIEEAITIEELSGRGFKRAKMARAYFNALRYAASCEGCRVNVTLDEVYESLFTSDVDYVTDVVLSLLKLMIPPEHLQTKEEPPESETQSDTPAKKNPSKKKDRKAGSSKRTT